MKRGGLSWEKLLVQDTLAGGVLGGGLQGIATSRDRTASVSGGGRIKSVPMPAVGGQEGRGKRGGLGGEGLDCCGWQDH